jgi:hypothetical protein
MPSSTEFPEEANSDGSTPMLSGDLEILPKDLNSVLLSSPSPNYSRCKPMSMYPACILTGLPFSVTSQPLIPYYTHCNAQNRAGDSTKKVKS